ncbi:GH25 family lysozyme [Herbidospora cretacea]|uniref:GH25 family lysozyme n=1 Tax=Herbidospora cretacea TaxID=28444 RepID=UPI0009ED5383|nr:GH25 family lysozyme [Herbidospora cretacea]
MYAALLLVATTTVMGADVSNWTGDVDWTDVKGKGAEFVFVHATEGPNYKSPRFGTQFAGAQTEGLYRGAYHFAQPHESGGREQADFFVRNGGNWTADGRTLPGVLDVEDNPYNNRNGLNSCYGLDQAEMVTWIGDWLSRYKAWTKRDAIIYTTTSWWKTCTGDTKKFAKNPLWIARWGSDPGELPAAWKNWTFWQKDEKAGHAGGSDAFNGSLSQLHALADPPVRILISGGAKSRSQYVLKISNTGAKLATKIDISGKTFGNNRLTYAPRACKRTATTVKCTINSLAPGKSATFKFSTRPRGTKPVGINFLVGRTKVTLK